MADLAEFLKQSQMSTQPLSSITSPSDPTGITTLAALRKYTEAYFKDTEALKCRDFIFHSGKFQSDDSFTVMNHRAHMFHCNYIPCGKTFDDFVGAWRNFVEALLAAFGENNLARIIGLASFMYAEFCTRSDAQIWLIMPEGADLCDPYGNENSGNWRLFEANVLTAAGSKIDKIIRVDAETFKVEGIVWRQRDGMLDVPRLNLDVVSKLVL